MMERVSDFKRFKLTFQQDRSLLTNNVFNVCLVNRYSNSYCLVFKAGKDFEERLRKYDQMIGISEISQRTYLYCLI